ncbi:MAG: element excision factor XisH family protein [Chloroflexota bacterium]
MAKDLIHDMVVKALDNDGWKILEEEFNISYKELEIYVDIVAERKPILIEKGDQKIIVEVKSFIGRSFMRDLQQALGQYELYYTIMESLDMDYELYLGIGSEVYLDYFVREATNEVIQKYKLNLLVVDLENKQVIKWLKQKSIKN